MPTYHVDISRRTTILKAALLLCCMVPAVTGQGSQPYELAPAYVDVEYCQNIMQSVAGLKNWRLKSVSPDPNYRWSMIGDKPKGLQMNDNGKIYAKPKGLQVNDDGEIYGRPEAEGVYVFTVRIADASLPQATPRELPVQLVVTIPIVSLEPAVEPQAMNAEPLDFSSPGAVATNNLTSEGESDSANKKTLVETNKKTLVDALTETLKSTDDVDLQTYAATQLGNLGVDAAKAMTIGELVKISKSKNKKVKFAAIKSLARIMASGGGATSRRPWRASSRTKRARLSRAPRSNSPAELAQPSPKPRRTPPVNTRCRHSCRASMRFRRNTRPSSRRALAKSICGVATNRALTSASNISVG